MFGAVDQTPTEYNWCCISNCILIGVYVVVSFSPLNILDTSEDRGDGRSNMRCMWLMSMGHYALNGTEEELKSLATDHSLPEISWTLS